MKTNKNKLVFGKTSIVELDSGQLNTVNGGTSTFPFTTLPSITPITTPPFPVPTIPTLPTGPTGPRTPFQFN